ncbi:sigma-70 family RNA polymerase sigma factor [Hymenobacter sp. YC55]|nr:sigma-70 family RNA polymerase sigma factor [Hymenobacter sp. YC55]MDF7815394.1 sigma-70 family RNA polymerase sigma factor [Hymenobacter sp. YC55]
MEESKWAVERVVSARTRADFRLIQAALEQGDQKAYAELYQRYSKPVFHVALKMVRRADDAEDLTAEVLAKAFRSLHLFKPDFAFSTWLFRITTNHCIDFLRRQRQRPTPLRLAVVGPDGNQIIREFRDAALNPQDALIRQQKIDRMRQVVHQLPGRYQTLTRLRYFDEFTYEEIAQQLHLPLGTVKAYLHRARLLLLELLKEQQHTI